MGEEERRGERKEEDGIGGEKRRKEGRGGREVSGMVHCTCKTMQTGLKVVEGE